MLHLPIVRYEVLGDSRPSLMCDAGKTWFIEIEEGQFTLDSALCIGHSDLHMRCTLGASLHAQHTLMEDPDGLIHSF